MATEIILTLGQAFEVAYQLTLIQQEESMQMSDDPVTPRGSIKGKRLSYIDIVDNI